MPRALNKTLSGAEPDVGDAESAAEATGVVTVHVFDVTLHAPHVGPGHDEVRVLVMVPVVPGGHGVEVSVCGEEASGVQDAVSGAQWSYWYDPESAPSLQVRV